MRRPETGPPECARSLWYYPAINRFADENGSILHDLRPYFETWQLDKWKRGKGYDVVKDRQGNLWELFYLEPEGCEHYCDTCRSKCEIFDMLRDF